MRRLGLALAVVLSTAALYAQGQGDRPVFRASVELIQIEVSVLDGKRQPVRGLAASDFTVLEDGHPRPIRVFQPVDLATRTQDGAAVAEAGAPVPPDVATNKVGEQDGRLVFIVLDRSIPDGQPTLAARRVATAAVDALGPGDLAAVVTTSGMLPQTLTADRGRLIAALNRGDWSRKWSPEQEEIMGKDDPLGHGDCLCGLCVLETITHIADATRDAPRRNNLLLFIGSSLVVQAGLRDPTLDVGCDRLVRDARKTMFDSLALSNLTVHSIDPKGIVNIGPQARAGARGGEGPNAEANRRQQMQDETNDHLADQGSLQVLPDLTGGRTVLNTNTPETAVPAIFHESDAYYVLGFEPAEPHGPEAARSIKVAVARRGLRVTAAREVFSPGEDPLSRTRAVAAVSSPTDRPLAGILPVAKVPLDLTVAAFASPDGANAVLNVVVNATALALPGARSLPLAVGVAAVTQWGRPMASATQTTTVDLPPPPVGATRAGALRVEVPTHLLLEPGDYEIRAAVSDPATGVASSVFSESVIPKFASEPLSLSGLVLGTRREDDRSSDASGLSLPIVATTQRTFAPGQKVWGFVQVYQGTQRTDPLAPVSLRTRLVDGSGRAVADEAVTLSESQFDRRRTDHEFTIPVDRLVPGPYTLYLDARLGAHAASRAVPFMIQ